MSNKLPVEGKGNEVRRGTPWQMSWIFVVTMGEASKTPLFCEYHQVNGVVARVFHLTSPHLGGWKNVVNVQPKWSIPWKNCSVSKLLLSESTTSW